MVTLFALAFLTSGNDILLLQRKNAAFGNGLYHLPGGKVEQSETALKACMREMREEVGLELLESDFKLIHVFHRKGTETELVALIFKADISIMTPINLEPEKHDDMRFFNLHELPENIIPAHKQALECIIKGINYSEHGW